MAINPAAPSYSNVTSPSNTAPSMLAARCHTDSTLINYFFFSNPRPNSLFIPSMSIYFLFNSSLSNSAAILPSGLAKVVAGSPTPGPTCAGSGQLYGAGQMPHLIPPQEVRPSPRASHSRRSKGRASGRPDLAELPTQDPNDNNIHDALGR